MSGCRGIAWPRRLAALAAVAALWAAGGAGGPRLGLEVLETSGPISATMARNLLLPVSGLQACRPTAAASLAGRRFEVTLQIPASPMRHRMVLPAVTLDPAAIVDRQLAGCVLGVLAQVRFPAAMAASTVRLRISLGAPARPAAVRLLVTGQIADAANGRPMAGATVLFLQPWVQIVDVDPDKLEQQVAAVAVTAGNGRFQSLLPLPRGFGYGLMVLARGFETATAEPGKIRAPDGSTRLELGRIELRRQRW